MTFLQTIEQDIQGIKEVFSGTKYSLIFLASVFFTGLIYFILTDIIIVFPGPVGLNPKLDLLNTSLILVIVVLTALVLTLTVFRLKKNFHENSGGKTGIAGSLLAVFATACPVCQPIWLVWLGLGSASLFLVEISTYIALASIALLLFALHLAAQAVYAKTCEIKKLT